MMRGGQGTLSHHPRREHTEVTTASPGELDALMPTNTDEHVRFSEEAIEQIVGQRVDVKAGSGPDAPIIGHVTITGAHLDPQVGGVVMSLHIEPSEDEAAQATMRRMIHGDSQAFHSEMAVRPDYNPNGVDFDRIEIIAVWPDAGDQG